MSDTATETSDITLTPKGERYCHDHTNAEYFAKLRALRKEAVAEIERLLTFLDDLDGDPEMEESGDLEPSLGWPDGRGPTFAPATDDLERDESDDEDGGDGEPSLGAPESEAPRMLAPGWSDPQHSRTPRGSQEHWAQGNRRDLEEEVGKDNREFAEGE